MAWFLDNNNTLLKNNREVYGGRYYKADYIEFDTANGNRACIDTGFTEDNNTTWDILFIPEILGTDCWFAGSWDLDNNIQCMAGTADGSYWYTANMAYYPTTPNTSGTQFIATKQTSGSTYSHPYTIIIGGRNAMRTTWTNPSVGNAENVRFKITYFHLKKNGTWVAEFFPAYDPVNEEWGMYEVISGQFFGNAGAEGSYIYGGYYTPESDIVTQTPEVLAFDYNHPPASMWILRDDIIVNALIPEPLIDDQGAFAECEYLTGILIPSTVESIGRYSFRDTGLRTVTLPANCTYYSTSFPSGCTVTGGQLIS